MRNNRFPPNVYLNRLRLVDFRRLFAVHLNVVAEELTRESLDPLTPALARELAAKGYGTDELLTRHAFFIARKQRSAGRAAPASPAGSYRTRPLRLR